MAYEAWVCTSEGEPLELLKKYDNLDNLEAALGKLGEVPS